MMNAKSSNADIGHLFERSSPRQRLVCGILAPLLIAQGLWVRRQVPKLPEASGRREGIGGRGNPLRILIVGDSSAAGVGAAHQDQALAGGLLAALNGHFRIHWKLIARSGWSTPELRRALQTEPVSSFDVALTATGLNDITARRPLRRCLEEQIRLVDLLKRRFAVKQVLISGMPPVKRFPSLPEPLRGCIGDRAARLDKAIHAWSANQPDCDPIRLDFSLRPETMAPDGFHPGPRIYACWAEAAATQIINRWN